MQSRTLLQRIRLAPSRSFARLAGELPVSGAAWRRGRFRDGRTLVSPPLAEGDPRLQRLEAVLFLARESISSRALSQYADLADGTEARTLVRLLNRRYEQQGRPLRVEEVAGGFRLLTRPQFASWLRRLPHVPSEQRLSPPALETLAVIAYRQPVLRADIEAIRGVNCGEILRQLLERDLIRIGGRSQELGRPYLYTTTRRFLQLFGLRSIQELPRAELFRAGDPDGSPPTQAPEEEKPVTRSLLLPAEEIDAVLHDPLAATTLAGATRRGLVAMDDDDLDDDDDDLADDDDDDLDDDDDDDDDLDDDDDDLDDDFEDDEWEEVDDDDNDEWDDDDDDFDDDDEDEEEEEEDDDFE